MAAEREAEGNLQSMQHDPKPDAAVRPVGDDFSSLFEFLPIGAYRSTPDGRQVRANPALVRLNGYENEPQMLAAVHDIAMEWYVEPGRRTEFQRMLEADGVVRGFVSEVWRHRSRERIWINENAHVVCDASGQVMFYEGTVEEVTGQMLALQAARRSESHLRQIASHMPAMVYRVHTASSGISRYSFVSEGIRQLYGITPEQLMADPRILRRFRHPDDLDRVDAEVQDAWSRDAPLALEYRIRLDDGTQKWLQMISSNAGIEDSEVVRVGVLLDVTARHEAEQGLRDSEARWKLALDSIGDGIWDWDLVTGREVLSDRCREIHGLTGSGAEPWAEHHLSLDARTHPDDVPSMQLDRAAHFEGRTPLYANEHRVQHADGSWRWVLSRGMVIARDGQGRPLRMIGTHTDITERKQAEALRAERDRAAAGQLAMTQFLSRVSHELRTPLNAILGFTQVMQVDAGTPSAHRRWLGEVMDSGRHLLGLVDDILDLTGAQSGQVKVTLAPVALEPVVRECLSMAASDVAGMQLALDCRVDGDALPQVLADRLRLKQIISNLLSNAVKYNRRGGRLVVEATASEGRVLLAVSDEGEGLTPEQLARLFTPFDRLGAQHRGIRGTGLGLSLSRQLARAMRGDIDASSVPGVGSTFTLRLCAAGHEAAPA